MITPFTDEQILKIAKASLTEEERKYFDDCQGNRQIEQFQAFAANVIEAYLDQQTPVCYQFQDRDGKWHGFIDRRHYENTVEDGSWPIRALYTAPPTAIPEGFENAINEAVKAEREACAAECERMVMYPRGKQEAPAHDNVWAAAKAIRERGEKK